MALDSTFVAMLKCPECQKSLIYFPTGESGDDESNGFLLSPDSGRRYRIENNIPVMLIQDSDKLEEAEVARLVALAKDKNLV